MERSVAVTDSGCASVSARRPGTRGGAADVSVRRSEMSRSTHGADGISNAP